MAKTLIVRKPTRGSGIVDTIPDPIALVLKLRPFSNGWTYTQRHRSLPSQPHFILGCHILSEHAAFFQPLRDFFRSCAILSDAAMFF
jgi:hypothetical protein